MLAISRQIGESLMVGPSISVTLKKISEVEARLEVGHPAIVNVAYTPHVVPPRKQTVASASPPPQQAFWLADRALPMLDLHHERNTTWWASMAAGLQFDGLVKVHILKLGTKRVLFGIEAPRSITILRREVWLEQLCDQLYQRTRTLEALLREVSPNVAEFVKMAS